MVVSFLRRLHMKARVRYPTKLTPHCYNRKYSSDQFPHLVTNSRLLQQVLLNTGPFNGPTLGEVDVDVLPKSTGVIVADGFSIAKS